MNNFEEKLSFFWKMETLQTAYRRSIPRSSQVAQVEASAFPTLARGQTPVIAVEKEEIIVKPNGYNGWVGLIIGMIIVALIIGLILWWIKPTWVMNKDAAGTVIPNSVNVGMVAGVSIIIAIVLGLLWWAFTKNSYSF
jgi:hypothetical protein